MDQNLMSELGKMITEETKMGTPMKRIDKVSFMENLAQLQTRYDQYLGAIGGLTDSHRAMLAKTIYKSAKGDNVACATYVAIAQALSSKDGQLAFETARFTATKIRTELRSLERQVNLLFSKKALTLYNAKLTHLVVFGLISEAELFIDYSNYMFDGITNEITVHNGIRELPKPLKYRIAKLESKRAQYISICKARLTNTSETVSRALAESGGSELNTELIGDDNTVSAGFANSNKIPWVVRGLATIGAKNRIIFRWLGEQWNILKHAKYLRTMREKEWLESHVALLQMELANTNPDDEEYRRHVKIIEAYNGMIAELDAKIDAYLED